MTKETSSWHGDELLTEPVAAAGSSRCLLEVLDDLEGRRIIER
jgi:hypothetical protein